MLLGSQCDGTGARVLNCLQDNLPTRCEPGVTFATFTSSLCIARASRDLRSLSASVAGAC